MMNNIEVEVRGPLSKKQYEHYKDFLSKKGLFVQEKRRVLIDYSTLMPEHDLEKRDKDIRIRVTNNISEIVVKLGSWGDKEARKELSVTTSDSFDTLVQIFAAIGYQTGVLCVRNSMVYLYEDIEFALVEVPGHSYYFEAELLISDRNKKNEAHEKIEFICTKLGMTIFSSEKYFAYVRQLNQEANTVFDFAKYQEGYFKKTFHLDR